MALFVLIISCIFYVYLVQMTNHNVQKHIDSTSFHDYISMHFLYICFWILLGISGGCITSIRGQNYKIHPSLVAHHNYDSNHAFLETQNRRSSFVSLKHFLFYIHNFFSSTIIAISQKLNTKKIISLCSKVLSLLVGKIQLQNENRKDIVSLYFRTSNLSLVYMYTRINFSSI